MKRSSLQLFEDVGISVTPIGRHRHYRKFLCIAPFVFGQPSVRGAVYMRMPLWGLHVCHQCRERREGVGKEALWLNGELCVFRWQR